MKLFKYGNINSNIILIQPVDDNDLKLIEEEYSIIKNNCNEDFLLIAVKINDWFNDLTPWNSKALYGSNDFGSNAINTLNEIIKICSDSNKSYYIGGYSLAALFSLWVSFNTNVFTKVAAASPSIWYPNFISYMTNNTIKANTVYLSLGDTEANTKNIVMKTVKDKIIEAYNILINNNIKCYLEWNSGNHFKDTHIRVAKAFLYLLNSK